MPVLKREKDSAPPVPARSECSGCSSQKVLSRISHHWGLLDRKSDSHPAMGRLREHLTKVYGSEYVESGKIECRVDFVREAWMIWRDHRSEEGRALTIEEAYNLAAARLNWQKKPTGDSPIERSQPSGDKN